jgi:hypothetical protein
MFEATQKCESLIHACAGIANFGGTFAHPSSLIG